MSLKNTISQHVPRDTVRRRKAETNTVAKSYQHCNEMIGVPFHIKKTGYKDPFDHCNRTDRHNGGEFRTYQSLYGASHCNVSQKPVKFRKDGIPVSAQRIPGKPLMSPKLPSRADLRQGARYAKLNLRSSIQLGNPNNHDPKQYKSISSLMYGKHGKKKALSNPGIAAEISKRAHKKVWG